jgi:formylglycine-generating enzyme required for sulfatase activity/tRNA A-37 threonylcarbamoyl transferase component Bud32
VFCPACATPIPDGAAACPACGRARAAEPATGTLTPPSGVPLPPVPSLQADTLAQRLQEAIGENYKVERALGAGGFAVVYLVRDLNLKRKLAVKVLSPDVIASKTALERFRREAETVAQLSHPNIVPLHFVGQKDDLVYLTMECVEGGSLADRLEKEGKLPADEVARIMREVAGALAHAHKRGVVHRDIKPHNVLLEAESGRCLVTDFGIARTAEASSLTASGMLVGTPAYLSPEQVSGHHSDHRSDIYALGVMGYEMLTGQPPFTGPTPTAVLMKRLAGDPTPIQKLRPDVPPAVRDAIEGCLAQNPDERFQSAADVVRALGGQTPVSAGHSTAEFVLRRRRERKRSVILAGAAAVLLVAVAALAGLWLRSRPTTPPLLPVDSGMVIVPGGLVRVGLDDGPAHVRPSFAATVDSFGIDVREVSVGDYAAFVAARAFPTPWRGEAPNERLPVTGVFWAEATSYCAWKHPDGGRLPSETEWEAAARGTVGRRFPWGDEWNPAGANTAGAQRDGPAPTGSYPAGATEQGVLDLHGNVWEWTSSVVAPYPGSSWSVPTGFADAYVIRGGAFDAVDRVATAALRGYTKPSLTDRTDLNKTGFRCVMPLRRPPMVR